MLFELYDFLRVIKLTLGNSQQLTWGHVFSLYLGLVFFFVLCNSFLKIESCYFNVKRFVKLPDLIFVVEAELGFFLVINLTLYISFHVFFDETHVSPVVHQCWWYVKWPVKNQQSRVSRWLRVLILLYVSLFLKGEQFFQFLFNHLGSQLCRDAVGLQLYLWLLIKTWT